MSNLSIASLREAWNELVSEEPELREREAAKRLGVSEAELIATRLGDGVTRLRVDSQELFRELGRADSILAITRNDAVVSEIRGGYKNPRYPENESLQSKDIDMRIMPGLFDAAFAVEVRRPQRRLQSIQFFDSTGTAVHKAYLLTQNARKIYREIVDRFAADDQATQSGFTPRPLSKQGFHELRRDGGAPAAESGEVRESLLAAWESMTDPHQFAGLLRKLELTRKEAFRIAQGTWTWRLEPEALKQALRGAAENAIPIMVFVGNSSCIQIFDGHIRETAEMGEWFNVMDAGFNLHAHMPDVAEAWRVRKPAGEHTVTSLEFIDGSGEVVLRVFGERERQSAEREDWRELSESLSNI